MHSNYYDPTLMAREVAEGRHREVIGGLWDEIGTLQMDMLKAQGLLPGHRLLDIGCGSLRLGVRAVAFLDAGNYWGTDLNAELMQAGYAQEIVPAGLAAKLPTEQLIPDADFAFPGQPRRFDFVLAQSVFTHLPLNHLRHCLARLAEHLEAPTSFLFTVFTPAPGTAPTAQSPQKNGTVTYPCRDPYHYDAADLAHAIRGLPWSITEIDWPHPRGQRLIRAELRG